MGNGWCSIFKKKNTIIPNTNIPKSCDASTMTTPRLVETRPKDDELVVYEDSIKKEQCTEEVHSIKVTTNCCRTSINDLDLPNDIHSPDPTLIQLYEQHRIVKSNDVELEEPLIKKIQRKRLMDYHNENKWVDRQPVQTKNVAIHGVADGKKTVNEYILIRPLGKGTFGKVKLCMNRETGELRAIKILNKQLLRKASRQLSQRRNALNMFKMEIAILERLDHPNVVKLYEVIDDEKNDKIYMIFEFVERSHLMKMTSHNTADRPPLTEAAARKCMIDLIYGLEYLHNMKVIHSDIKPENLLVDKNNTVKLTDFGVSTMFEDDDTLYSNRGTPAFLAPEACKGGKFNGKPADIWAVGVTLYCLLYARTPFQGDSFAALLRSIQKDEPKYPDDIDPLLLDLFKRILEKDPKKRLTLEELKQHDWITNRKTIVLRNPKERNGIVQITKADVDNAINTAELKIIQQYENVLN